jgi:hypothetical protein
MTGGCVVVLGKVGRNVAAGRTGGLAYLRDEDDTLLPYAFVLNPLLSSFRRLASVSLSLSTIDSLSLSRSGIILYFCDCVHFQRGERGPKPKEKKRLWLAAESIPSPYIQYTFTIPPFVFLLYFSHQSLFF